MSWISFSALPCRKKNLMTACVSMLLTSHASLKCFRARFLPGRAKDLSAPLVQSTRLYTSNFTHLWNFSTTYAVAVCTVKTPDDGQRNSPKHVEFYSKNKFEKLVHLVGFTVWSTGIPKHIDVLPQKVSSSSNTSSGQTFCTNCGKQGRVAEIARGGLQYC